MFRNSAFASRISTLAICIFAAFAAFAANEPDVYLEWLGDANGGYINTGYVFKKAPRLEAGVILTSSGSADIFGTSTAAVGCFIAETTTGTSYFYRYGTSGSTWAAYGTPPSLNTATFNDAVWADEVFYNGVRVGRASSTGSFADNTQVFNLFKGRTHNRGVKFSYARMYDGGVLVRDFRPAKKDGVAGMYDVVNDIFYTSATSDKFTEGAEIAVDDCVFVDSNTIRCGNPSPSYGPAQVVAGGTITMSTARYAMSANGLMECVGWDVYDSVSANEYDATPRLTGTGCKAEYVHPSPAKGTKFVWKWVPVSSGTVVTSIADGEWDSDATWSTGAVPGINDIVVVTNSVHCSGDVAAKTLVIQSGTLRFHASTSYAIKDSTPDAPGNGSFSFRVADDLAVINGGLALHGGRDTPVITNLELSVGGDFLLYGNSAACVAAAAFDGACVDATNLYNTAAVLTIGGKFAVLNSSLLYPVCDQKVGSPVRFRCASFELGQGASVYAHERGWHLLPTPADPRSRHDYGGRNKYSLALGAGKDGTGAAGGGYGGRGSQAGSTWGKSYGYKYAPYLPGSNSGGDSNWSLNYLDGASSGTTRGGGVFWLTATGLAKVDGEIKANAVKAGYQAASGGGVWLNAGSFAFGENAKIDAHGGDYGNSTKTLAGGGGRISLSKGLTEEQLVALAQGDEPEGLIYADSITIVDCDVRAGNAVNPSTPAEAGTTTYVSEAATVKQMSVRGIPVEAGIVTPGYGDYTEASGTEFNFSTFAYGDDPGNATWRYRCLGYVISNDTAEVASGDTITASYMLGGVNLSFNWLWGEREYLNYLTVIGPGSVSVDGESYDVSTNIYKKVSEQNVYTAIPDSGAEFLYWTGDVPESMRFQSAITLPADGQWHPKAMFRKTESVAVFIWKDDAEGDFYDDANWVDGRAPGRTDAALIGSGTARLPNYLELGSLTVTGGLVRAALENAADGCTSNLVVLSGDLTLTDAAQLRLGVTDGSSQMYNTLRVGGNLILHDAAILSLTAGRRSSALGYTWATGCGFVVVGGDFRLEGTSEFRPNCAGYNGGSVKTTVGGTFSVGPSAKVDAAGRGNGVYYELGWNPGVGSGGATASAHGGRGTHYADGVHTLSTATYDYLYAPMMPGQQNRDQAAGGMQRGSGNIRVVAANISIKGTVTADAIDYSSGNPSAGTIWLTSFGPIHIGADAVITARGAWSTAHPGIGASGGGRISLCKYVKPWQLDALTVSPNAIPEKLTDITEEFLAEHTSLTNAVAPGAAALDFPACWGTFKVLCGSKGGMVLMLK